MHPMDYASAKEPDALGKGRAIGHPNPAHLPSCSGGGALDSVLKVVSFIVSEFGGHISHHAYCGNEKREIATGVTVSAPAASKEPHPRWGYMGGQGAVMADSAICLMKDIGNAPGHRIVNHTPTTSGLVPSSTEQIVGLESFDPVAKRAVLYHVVRACAPMIGCMDAARQTITAQVRKNVPAWPAKMSAGDFPIHGTYAVEMDSQWSASDFNITLPQITIPTPYGSIAAQPKVTWGAGLMAIETPFATRDARILVSSPRGRGTSTAVIQDTYGLSGTPFILQAATNMYKPPPQGFGKPGGDEVADVQGWSSQIGFGTRNGAAGTSIWNPGTNKKNPPQRPDLNLDVPRDRVELGPSGRFTAQVPITYSPPNPVMLLPAAIRSYVDISLKITVNPQMAADFASQVGIIARDVDYTNCFGTEFGEPCNLSEVLMPMRAKATGRARIDGKVDLHIVIHLPFVDPIDVHPGFHINLPGGDAAKPGGTYSDSNPYAHVARATRLTFDRPDNGRHGDTLVSPAGTLSSDLNSWRKVCLETPAHTSSPPPPSHQPDNKTYMPDLLPCNICATDASLNKYNNGQPVPRIYDVKTHSYATAKEWVCQWRRNAGCYDLCTWNHKSGQFIAAVRSAVDIVGQRCHEALEIPR